MTKVWCIFARNEWESFYRLWNICDTHEAVVRALEWIEQKDFYTEEWPVIND